MEGRIEVDDLGCGYGRHIEILNDERDKREGRYDVEERELSVGRCGWCSSVPRPLSKDRSVPQVSDQAGILAQATRKTEARKVLKSIPTRLLRLVVNREAGNSPGNSGAISPGTTGSNRGAVNLVWSEEENRSIESDGEIAAENEVKAQEDIKADLMLAERLNKVIKATEKETKKLCWFVREGSNTKREIKESVVHWKSLVSLVSTNEAKMMFQGMGQASIRENIETKPCKVCEERENQQTTEEEKRKQQNKLKTKRIQEGLETATNYEEFERVASEQWPKETFVATTVETRDITLLPMEYDLAWPMDEEMRADKGVPEKVATLCARPEDLNSQEVKRGEVAYLILLPNSRNREIMCTRPSRK